MGIPLQSIPSLRCGGRSPFFCTAHISLRMCLCRCPAAAQRGTTGALFSCLVCPREPGCCLLLRAQATAGASVCVAPNAVLRSECAVCCALLVRGLTPTDTPEWTSTRGGGRSGLTPACARSTSSIGLPRALSLPTRPTTHHRVHPRRLTRAPHSPPPQHRPALRCTVPPTSIFPSYPLACPPYPSANIQPRLDARLVPLVHAHHNRRPGASDFFLTSEGGPSAAKQKTTQMYPNPISINQCFNHHPIISARAGGHGLPRQLPLPRLPLGRLAAAGRGHGPRERRARTALTDILTDIHGYPRIHAPLWGDGSS